MDWIRLLEWGVGLFATFGLLGAVALFFLLPAVFTALLQTVSSGLAAIIKTPIGAAVLAGSIMLTVGLFYGDHSGRTIERANCAAAQVRAEHEAAARDAQQGELADQDAAKMAADLAAQLVKERGDFDDYKRTEATRFNRACAFKSDDL